ncbi:MAG: phytanoyl-CoA dioxygenase family protein [Fimbriimonadaceae bacterium]|nr:phytanoyl-CoA dioxygenase family protein [Fimbriimonadaceae bacterium]
MSVCRIRPSEAEKSAGSLTPENLAKAREALIQDGLLVLEEVVPLEIIEPLRDRMIRDAELLLARPDRPFNWNTGNLQQNPPVELEFLHREILANDLAIQCTHSVLGNGLKNAFYSGNNALKSEERQPVHADMPHLWPDRVPGHPAYAFVVNVAMVDTSAANGSTELWPGTHLLPGHSMQAGNIELDEATIEARRATDPPVQLDVAAGSLVIRDVRLWHAGMPNRTDAMRPMIAMIHHIGWWPTEPIRLPKGAEAIVEHPVMRTHAEYVEDEIDHIAAPQAYGYEEK